MPNLTLKSNFTPSGDQPKAISYILESLAAKNPSQTIEGVTGSGKTFTMANIIEKLNKPSLIMVPNKTLAAQIYYEMKELFPDNAVEYFVSYYDYYQPEAYISKTDTYIEKDALINEQIDLMRHSATRSLFERKDVIVVSSVSCIYGLGSPDLYYQMTLNFQTGEEYVREEIFLQLTKMQYKRNDISFQRGIFRVRGENIDIFPSHYDLRAWRLEFWGTTLENIYEFDPLTGENLIKIEKAIIYANSHFSMPQKIIKQALKNIKQELEERIEFLDKKNKFLEKERLKQRVTYDIEMIKSTGSCSGIENYSRFFNGRLPGEPPPTLFEYISKDTILFVDESHVMVPQIRAMYNGDRIRKKNLVDNGFRLPSALDNRPLKFEEWLKLKPQTVYVSATPGEFEITQSSKKITHLINRPTGLLDPECIISPSSKQIEHLIHQINQTIKQNGRVLVTTLTKKNAEDLTNYLRELGQKVEYLHSSVKTLERIQIIKDLREGNIDIVVGINLLREGLDIPECSLVAILDADKEGFLRSTTSLIQTIGRASRNINGKVLIYADQITQSIKKAIEITNERREIQKEFNEKNNVTPKTITKKIYLLEELKKHSNTNKKKNQIKFTNKKEIIKYIENLNKKMKKEASNLEFEKAAKIRDEIGSLKQLLLNENYTENHIYD